MSACEMIPQQQPLASTTGTRRIWFSSITEITSARVVSSFTTTTGSDMHSAAVTADGILALGDDADDDVAVGDDANQAVGTVSNRDLAAIRLDHEVRDFIQKGLSRATLGRRGHDFTR